MATGRIIDHMVRARKPRPYGKVVYPNEYCAPPPYRNHTIQDYFCQCVSPKSLSPELKDAALLRFCKIVEARATLVESFALNQVLYRTISGNTFTESAESVAARTGCNRKTILKGLKQAVSQNILEENKRPGTSNEYSFKPVEEWKPEPVVRIKDIRNNKIIEFLYRSDSWWAMPTLRNEFDTDLRNSVLRPTTG